MVATTSKESKSALDRNARAEKKKKQMKKHQDSNTSQDLKYTLTTRPMEGQYLKATGQEKEFRDYLSNADRFDEFLKTNGKLEQFDIFLKAEAAAAAAMKEALAKAEAEEVEQEEEQEEEVEEVEQEEEVGESAMDEDDGVSELGSVGGSSVGSLGLSGLSADAPNGPADAEVTTPQPTPLSYPKPPGRVPKGKAWDGATGRWIEMFVCNQGEEEGGDAKRAKTE